MVEPTIIVSHSKDFEHDVRLEVRGSDFKLDVAVSEKVATRLPTFRIFLENIPTTVSQMPKEPLRLCFHRFMVSIMMASMFACTVIRRLNQL